MFANFYYANQDYKLAATNFETVIIMDPNIDEAYQHLSNCYLHLK
jgi:Tfp pilus assembly protein PilF